VANRTLTVALLAAVSVTVNRKTPIFSRAETDEIVTCPP